MFVILLLNKNTDYQHEHFITTIHEQIVMALYQPQHLQLTLYFILTLPTTDFQHESPTYISMRTLPIAY